MDEALKAIALYYACSAPDCDLHTLKPNSSEVEFLCPGCVASLALRNELKILRVPTVPEMRAEFHAGLMPAEPPFGSVTLLKRAVTL